MENISEQNTKETDTIPGLKEKENNFSLEEYGAKALNKAISETGSIVQQGNNLQSNPEITEKEKEEIVELTEETGKQLGIFYRKLKTIIKATPLLLMLGSSPEKPLKVDLVQEGIHRRNAELTVPVEKRKLSMLSDQELPPLAYLADRWLEGNIVSEYNKAVSLYNQRVNGKMTQAEIDFKEDLAQNIEPFEYNETLTGPIEKLEELEKGEKGKENKYSREKVEQMSLKYKIRVDLLRKYLGLPEFGNYVRESKYKPTRAQDPSATYYSFDTQQIIKDIKESSKKRVTESSKEDRLENNEDWGKEIITFEDVKEYINKRKTFPRSVYLGTQLGKYGTYIAFDKEKNEEYLSYYDLWDLDPEYFKDMAIDINQFNFPFEIYGRIYKSEWDAVKN